MDNHRAAAWCWAQKLNTQTKFSIFHIDRHYDLLQSALDEWCTATPPIENLSIDKYLNLKYEMRGIGACPVFRWDNYFPIFIKQREALLKRACFLTHEQGDKPWFSHEKKTYFDAPEDLSHWLSTDAPWIINVDMDFFFIPIGVGDDRVIQAFSDTYVQSIAKQIKMAMDIKAVACVTLAISPEMCGGWTSGLVALNIFADVLGFKLPNL
jgi:hypothetical protein